MLPVKVLNTDAFKTLSHATVHVLVLIAGEYNGHNNGALGLSKTQAASHSISNRTLYRALRSLEARGLIDRTYHSSRVPPRPTMFALTWVPLDNTNWTTEGVRPAKTYLDWKPQPVPKKTTPRKRLHAVK